MNVLRSLRIACLAAAFFPAASHLRAGSSPFGTHDQPVIPAPVADDFAVTPLTLSKKIFKVGHVGEPGQPKREELLAAFTAFQTQYAVDAAGKITAVAPWKDDGLAEITGTLQQDPQNGLYLLGPDAAHCIFIKAPEKRAAPWAVGDKLHVFAYKTGLQTWTSEEGAEQKSPLYEEVALPLPVQPAAPTREQFLAALRAGQTFDVLTIKSAASPKPAFVLQKISW